MSNSISPNSGDPLLCLLSLNLEDPCLNIKASLYNRIDFLYSWNCGIVNGDFFYRIKNQSMEILKYEKGSVSYDFPYAGYPKVFPEIPCYLELVNDKELGDVKFLNKNRRNFKVISTFSGLDIPYHQVGGEPYFLQDYCSLKCPDCDKEMFFIAAIGNENGTPLGFCGNDFVQVIFQFCPTCSVVGAYNMCD